MDYLIKAKFTKRETEVLENLVKGLRYQEIADKLYVSKTTIITHANSIKLKTNAKTIAHMIAIAVFSGLIKMEKILISED